LNKGRRTGEVFEKEKTPPDKGRKRRAARRTEKPPIL